MKELYYAEPERREYPELPYTFINHTIRWLLRVGKHTPYNSVGTLPQLPDEISWVEVDMIPIGGKMMACASGCLLNNHLNE